MEPTAHEKNLKRALAKRQAELDQFADRYDRLWREKGGVCCPGCYFGGEYYRRLARMEARIAVIGKMLGAAAQRRMKHLTAPERKITVSPALQVDRLKAAIERQLDLVETTRNRELRTRRDKKLDRQIAQLNRLEAKYVQPGV